MRRDTPAVAARRTVVVGACRLLLGCLETDRAEDADAAEDDNPVTGEASQRGDLTLTSPAFGHGDRIPERYGDEAENVTRPWRSKTFPTTPNR